MILRSEQVEEVGRRLSETLRPSAIYLFGSQGSGTANEAESDVDLCVVVPDDDENIYLKTVKAYRSLRDLDFSKDVIVRYESHFLEKSRWVSSIEREISEKGRLIYRG